MTDRARWIEEVKRIRGNGSLSDFGKGVIAACDDMLAYLQADAHRDTPDVRLRSAMERVIQAAKNVAILRNSKSFPAAIPTAWNELKDAIADYDHAALAGGERVLVDKLVYPVSMNGGLYAKILLPDDTDVHLPVRVIVVEAGHESAS